MWSRCNLLPLCVPHFRELLTKRRTHGLKDLDLLPQLHVIALFHRCDLRFLIIGAHKPDKIRGLFIGGRTVDLIRLRRLSKEKARCIGTVRDLFELRQPLLTHLIRGARKTGIESHTIRLDHACDIVNTLHASLDLETVNAGVHDLVQIWQQTEILRVHDVGAARILLDRIALTGARLLHERVFPSTGLGTAAAVRIAAREIAAEQASSRVGDAHRPVHEEFQLHIRMTAYLADLLT